MKFSIVAYILAIYAVELYDVMVRILATKGITTVGVNAAADNGERVIVDVVAAAAELDVRIELTVGDEGVVVVIVVNGDDGGGGDVVDLVGSRDAE